MLNLGFVSLISFILIYLNIIILNEETFILLCFITFCWIILTRIGESTSFNLKERSLKTKDSLIISLNSLIKILFSTINTQTKSKNLAWNFKLLGEHFLQFGYTISDKLPIYTTQKIEELYPKKLNFAWHLEQQTTKLLTLILVQKLNKIIFVQKFYVNDLKISNFVCVNKIILREYFEII